MKRRKQKKPRPKAKAKPRARAKPRAKPKLEIKELQLDELKAIIERARTSTLTKEDVGKLDAAVDTLAFLTQELEAKGASIKRLRNLLFGPSTEKTSKVVGDPPDPGANGSGEAGDDADDAADDAKADDEAGGDEPKGKPRKKRPGHGRNGAADYKGADKVAVPHESLEHKDPCPACIKGKVYRLPEPAVIVRVQGVAPLSATVTELERLRCNLCGEVFTAKAPPDLGEDKYDETATAMIGLLKYGCGLPFHRMERLEGSLGIPLPASTQWDVVERAASKLDPVYQELIRQAAQGKVVHTDDTAIKILDVDQQIRKELEADDGEDVRTGMFTTGIVSTGDGHEIALFFTGRQHAGENLADVLAHRAAELPSPIQMSDALSSNTAGDFETVVAHCLAHARRRFVEVVDSFPDECRHVLEELKKVYLNDAEAKKREMSPEERLRFHKEHSAPVMKRLKRWLKAQLDEHKVEPNSGLGEAIRYMLKHWQELTVFLREAGAPLDNNQAERVLKRPILHRKNALFYKTENGAGVGDLFMSLIHTAELCGANVFEYFVALQRHHEAVAEAPGDWMPWSYQDALARIASEP